MRIVASKKQTRIKQPIRATLHRQAKHLLVPHKGNEYRPHLIRWQGLSIVLALMLMVQIGYGFVTTGKVDVLGRSSDITVSGLLKETNQARTQAGLSELTLNEKLNAAAYAKAKDMFEKNYWAHDSPTGVKPWKWLADADYNYDFAGENLAKNYINSRATLDAWLASSTHRANVLGKDYTDVGFAVVEDTLNGKDTTVVVAFYASPATTQAAGVLSDTVFAPIGSTATDSLSYFAAVFRSFTPATLVIFALLFIIMIVSMVAHHYRFKLPKRFQKTWKLHHGAYKALGVGVVIVLLVISTSTGQI